MSLIDTIKKHLAGIIVAFVAAIGGTAAIDSQTFEAPNLDANAYPFVAIEAAKDTEGTFGANQINFVGGKVYSLSSGVTAAATTITLTSFDTPVTDTALTMSDFGTIGYGTIEPSSSARREFISFTGVTQNADGTAQLTGVTRGLQFVSPYTSTTTLQLTHAGGSRFVISNPPQLYNEAAFKGNNETISGSWSFPTPTGSNNPATKAYVDGVVTGGTLSYDQIIIAGTAGETFATGTIIYLEDSDGEWYKADASEASTSVDAVVGIAQGAGTDGINITNGVLIRGLDDTQAGLSTGDIIYLSNTSGATSTSPGTITLALGIVDVNSKLIYDPTSIGGQIAFLGGNNTWTGTNTFDESITGHASTSVLVFTSSGTWTKPSGLEYIVIKGVGGGGGGGSVNDHGGGEVYGGGGGASGGYFEKIIPAADLSSSETVTIGSGGGVATAGGTTLFGSHATATGGNGGTSNWSNNTDPAQGGTATGGDINISGSDGIGGGTEGTDNGNNSPLPSSDSPSMLGSYGHGGQGGYTSSSDTGHSGGAGVVIVYQYF